MPAHMHAGNRQPLALLTGMQLSTFQQLAMRFSVFNWSKSRLVQARSLTMSMRQSNI
jgi:hypothetical protein